MNLRSMLSANETKEFLNILVVGATHERYEQQLCLTKHRFYSYNDGGKEWNHQYGQKPKNYITLDFIPSYIRPDLVLTHVSGHRLELAHELSNHYGVKVIRHTHTLPQSPEELRAYHSQSAHYNTFISEFSRKAWGDNNGIVINHGLDTEFWKPLDCKKNDTIFSVVNFFRDRDWACGYTLYEQIKKLHMGHYKLAGNNPGLSVPATSLKALRDLYNECGIFLNTSQFSPIPMSVLEALACGCLVISSDTCMIPEIIKHGENGLLAKTPEEFVKCIQMALDEPGKCDIFRANARKTIVDSFNITKFIDNWNNIFRRALIK